MPNPRSQLELNQLLDHKLQNASDLGLRLATMLASFEKEVSDWQASIAHLRGATSCNDVSKKCSTDVHLDIWGKCHQPTVTIQESALHAQKVQEFQAAEVLKQERSRYSTHSLQSLQSLHSFHSMHTVDSAQSVKIASQTLQPQLWDLWTTSATSRRKLQSAGNQFVSIHEPSFGSESAMFAPVSCMDRFVINPLSPLRYILDTLSLVVVIYDMVTFPLMAFDFDETHSGKYWRFISASYWTVDLLFSFFSGYQLKNGDIEMRFSKVIKWRIWTILFDLTIVLLDWSLYILDQAKGGAVFARITKSARLVRLARLIRAVRSRRLFTALESVKRWPISDSMFTLLNVMRLILKVMLINHFLGCGWYAVGTIDPDHGQSWIHQFLYMHDSKFMHYLVSYHWAIAQFTPCPMNIHPQNVYERLYAVILLPFGLVIFAVLLGSVTAIVNTSRKNSYEQLMANHNLQEFLRTNKVPRGLSTRIQFYIKAHRIKKTRILESDVPTLATLASSLRQELHFEIHGPILKIHPIFQMLGNGFHDTFVHFCHSATKLITLPFGEEIFRYRSKGENMLMPLSGTLEYVAGRQLDDSHKVFIKSGGWVCEFPLWISWEHRGLLTVAEQTDLVVINTDKIRKAASNHSTSLLLLKKYARLFAQTLALDADKYDIEIDDLWGTIYGRTFRIFEDVEHLESALQDLS